MIKWIFRWAFRLLILLVVLVVAGILLLDTFAREYVEYQIRHETGMDVKIGKVRVSLLYPEITIENMVLYNTAAFGGSPFIEMPELHVEYDRDALVARKLRCKLMRFNLSRINIVEDKKGRRNFDMLESKVVPPKDAGKGKGRSAGVQFGGIDTLNLTLGKLTYLQMKQPGKVNEFNLNVDHQIFTGIKTEQDFQGALTIALIRSGANLFEKGGSGQNLLQLFAPKK